MFRRNPFGLRVNFYICVSRWLRGNNTEIEYHEHTQRNGRARRSCATAPRNGLRRKLMCIKVQDVRSWA